MHSQTDVQLVQNSRNGLRMEHTVMHSHCISFLVAVPTPSKQTTEGMKKEQRRKGKVKASLGSQSEGVEFISSGKMWQQVASWWQVKLGFLACSYLLEQEAKNRSEVRLGYEPPSS